MFWISSDMFWVKRGKKYYSQIALLNTQKPWGDLCYTTHSFKLCFLFSAKQIKTPKFDGSGYLSFTMPETKSIRHITSFSLELKTTSIDGMILWIGQDLSSDDYLGVGIRKGMVHLVWNLGKWPFHIAEGPHLTWFWGLEKNRVTQSCMYISKKQR